MRAQLAVVWLLACAACTSPASTSGSRLSDAVRDSKATFSVQKQEKDERGLDRAIAAALEKRGLKVVEGAGSDSRYVVRYVDKWYWDMRIYLIDLRIDVRDARTNQLLGTGRSFQTSLWAMGDSYDDVVAKAVAILLDGTGKPPAKTAD